jgi:lipoprotein-releasing system ATP-binding protein
MQQEAFILELDGIKKTFNVGEPNEAEVLHGIHMTLKRGEFCAIVGPSGSGKSTLLNIVGLLDRPTQGSLRIVGQETVQLEDAALTRLRGHTIGFVFQYHHLINAFTALENVMMPMLADRGFPSEDIQQQAQYLLDSVGLTPWLNSPAARLSGGQQQRVAIARALAMKPALILADEPTGNLDTQSARIVFDLLRNISAKQGMSVLFVTHNELLAKNCDRTLEVIDGMIR